MAVMLGMLGAFFLGIIIVLYVTLKKSARSTITPLAGARSARGSWP